MLIGLTGQNASGKGAIARYLGKKGFLYFSLSDILRNELKRRGKRSDREALLALGNELREEEGAGILAELILKCLPGGRSCVIDSIRNPAEVEALRKRKDFMLVAVEAPIGARFERIKNRGREQDPKTFEAFVELEERESRGKEDNHQQLARTIALADFVISNDGTLEDLEDKVEKLMRDIESGQTE
jgi:dephospho-CoA kinase